MKFAEKLVSQLIGVAEGPVLYDVKGEAASKALRHFHE